MIGKLIKGSSAAGLITYVTAATDHEGRERESVVSLGGTVPGRTPKELSQGFEALASLRPGLEKSVSHLMLRWTAEDRPSLEEQSQMAAAHAEALGYQSWSAWSHGDHLHVAASRINSDGSVVSDSWDWKRAEESVRALEQRFSLTPVAPSHLLDTKAADNHRAAPSAAELGAAGHGESSIRLQLQQAVDAALEGGPEFGTFADRLDAVGVGVRPNLQSSGRIAGLSFRLGDVEMKGAALGKAYTWGSLQKRGLDYEQSRDSEIARECVDRLAGAEHQSGNGAAENHSEGSERNGRAPSGHAGISGADVSAVGSVDSGAHGGIAPNNGHALQVAEAGTPGEPDIRPKDGGRSGGDLQEPVGASAAAGSCGPGATGSDGDNNASQPIQPPSNGAPGRSPGGPAGAGGSALASLAGGGGLDGFEAIDGSEDGAEALRKWGRNAARALKASQTADAAAKKKSPPHAPGIAHLAALAGRNPGVRTLQAVRAQISAFDVQAFEVGVLPPRHRTDLKPERTRRFSAEQLADLKTVAWLRRMNSLDRDIYIRPAPLPSGQLAPLVFVDDLSAEQVGAMSDAGLPLAVPVESSPGRFHGWVRVADQPITKTEANALARELAQRFGGDPGAAAWNQYGRLSGFTNRKVSRRTDRGAPFAKLVAASQAVAANGPSLLAEIRQAIEHEQKTRDVAERRAADRQRAIMALGGDRYLESAATAFQEARRKISATKPSGEADESARDFGAARELLRRGYEPEHVVATIIAASPDVYGRHPDAEEYARRTAEAARRGLQSRRTEAGFGPRPR